MEDDLFRAFPKDLPTQGSQIVRSFGNGKEMVAGQLTDFAGEADPAIGEQNLGLADAARVKQDLTRCWETGVVFETQAQIERAEGDPAGLATPSNMDDAFPIRQQTAKFGAGKGGSLILEFCPEGKCAGSDLQLAHTATCFLLGCG